MTSTYTEGKWESVPSRLDGARTLSELYQRLGTLGFSTYKELTCRTGTGRLYLRQDDAGQPAYPYNFYCLLYIFNFGHGVLLKDVPTLCQFLIAIDAHLKEQGKGQSVIVSNFFGIEQTLEQVITLLQQIKRDGLPVWEATDITTTTKQTNGQLSTDSFDLASLPALEEP